MKIAIIHYWWITNRGGEAVVCALSDLYPSADIFLHVGDDKLIKKTLGDRFKGNIFKTFISKLPWPEKFYQRYLPLMPRALEALDMCDYDLVISSESGPAKGVITRPDAIHLCYCHSPMRYIWDMEAGYKEKMSWLPRKVFGFMSHRLRIWDFVSSARVDGFIANSNFISSRIKKYYRRESTVIYPPVNVSEFNSTEPRQDYYLCLGQLVGYKKADLAVAAFKRLKLPLIVIGEGELFESLNSDKDPHIKLLGRQEFSIVKYYLETCKALIFPGVEDFGIVPVEAMASGAPVIAFDHGGARDTVIDGETGILFKEQTVESLCDAVSKIESGKIFFDKNVLVSRAKEFDVNVFKTKISKIVADYLTDID